MTMMLLLDPGRVAAGLRTGELTEAQKAKLVLGGFVVVSLLTASSASVPRTWGGVLYAVLYLACSVAGIWSCFRANEEGDGRSFVERYVCLSAPLSVLMYLAYVVLFYGAFFVLRHRPGYDAASFAQTVAPYFVLVGLALLFGYFALLRKYIKRIAAPISVGTHPVSTPLE